MSYTHMLEHTLHSVSHSSSSSSTSLVSPLPKPVYKLAFLGDPGAGKSSLVTRICYDFFDSDSPTDPSLSTVSHKEIVLDGISSCLELYDTGHPSDPDEIADAEEKKRAWVRDCDAVVIVYSTAYKPWRETAMQRVREHWEFVQREGKEKHLLVLGAQKDRVEERVVGAEEGEMVSVGLGADFAEGSAKEGEGIERAIWELMRKIRERREEKDRIFRVPEVEEVHTKLKTNDDGVTDVGKERGFWRGISDRFETFGKRE